MSTSKTPRERFWEKVERTESCWLWTASRIGGYGQFKLAGRSRKAHTVAYEWLVGPIPVAQQLDHLCRVRHCVNPEHLEPVSGRVNLLRSPDTLASLNLAKMACPQGHPYDEANTRLTGTGRRVCRACCRDNARAYRSRNVELLAHRRLVKRTQP